MRYKIISKVLAGGYLHNSMGVAKPAQDFVPKVGTVIEGQLINKPYGINERGIQVRGISYTISTGPSPRDEKMLIFIPESKLKMVSDTYSGKISRASMFSFKSPVIWVALGLIGAIVVYKKLKK